MVLICIKLISIYFRYKTRLSEFYSSCYKRFKIVFTVSHNVIIICFLITQPDVISTWQKQLTSIKVIERRVYGQCCTIKSLLDMSSGG